MKILRGIAITLYVVIFGLMLALTGFLVGLFRRRTRGTPQSHDLQEAPALPTGKGEFPLELSDVRALIESTQSGYVAITAKRADNTPAWASKYRGLAFWPTDVPYPTDPQGKPLMLLVQINFAEMPALEGYPEKGILQLFLSGEDSMAHVWGQLQYDEKPYIPQRWFLSLQDQRYFRVVFHENPDCAQPLIAKAPQAGPDEMLPIMEEAALSFERKDEYVLPDDYRFERIVGKTAYDLFHEFGDKEDDVMNRYLDFAHAWVPAKIGGYASFVQGDPREVAPEEDWLLLLEIQSDWQEDGVEVLWGDAGVGGLFIRRADLERRDFSKVAYYWDNH